MNFLIGHMMIVGSRIAGTWNSGWWFYRRVHDNYVKNSKCSRFLQEKLHLMQFWDFESIVQEKSESCIAIQDFTLSMSFTRTFSTSFGQRTRVLHFIWYDNFLWWHDRFACKGLSDEIHQNFKIEIFSLSWIFTKFHSGLMTAPPY